MVHLAGEDGPGFKLSTLGGMVTIERTDEALTPYGGLAAWSAFVQHLGIIERLAAQYPGPRNSGQSACASGPPTANNTSARRGIREIRSPRTHALPEPENGRLS